MNPWLVLESGSGSVSLHGAGMPPGSFAHPRGRKRVEPQSDAGDHRRHVQEKRLLDVGPVLNGIKRTRNDASLSGQIRGGLLHKKRAITP